MQENPEFVAFARAVHDGDVTGARAALAGSAVARARINDAVFDFGQRALHVAAANIPMLEALLEFGADVSLLSDWKNGPYSVLDHSSEESATFLIGRGASLTPNAAARLGWFDELRRIVDLDPAAVHQRGGDGQQPLHQAKTVEIAEYLLDHGAGIDVPCIDHSSTPAQYALVERPDVCRRLLARGARPDIFMAAGLGDEELAGLLIAADPACVGARVNAPGYTAVPEFNIYCWTLGFGVSPHEVALKHGHREIYDRLVAASPARVLLLEAASRGDERGARAALARDPSLIASLTAADHGQLAQAIFHGRFAAADLMLRLGFDPKARGTDGGTALHMACWMGHLPLVEQLLSLNVPIDDVDPTHGSTPLGWAAFGSVHRCVKGADYVGVVERLLAAGASTTLPGNGGGRSMVEMADGNPEVQAALRRHGAVGTG